MQIVRNNNGGQPDTSFFDSLQVEENVFLGTNAIFGNPAIALSGGANFTPVTFAGNYISQNSGGLYTTGPTSAMNWGTNFDADSGATISP